MGILVTTLSDVLCTPLGKKKTVEGGGCIAPSPPKKRLEPDILTDCLLYTLIVLEPISINGQVYDTGFKINNFRKDNIKKSMVTMYKIIS